MVAYRLKQHACLWATRRRQVTRKEIQAVQVLMLIGQGSRPRVLRLRVKRLWILLRLDLHGLKWQLDYGRICPCPLAWLATTRLCRLLVPYHLG
jgi:hypothetical protein